MLGDNDTIAAIATAKGMGALGIVRVSGPDTHDLVSKCFDSRNVDLSETHRAFYGVWRDPKTSSPIDEVILLNFTEGRGFTGEPSVDVICHGGVQVTELVLEAALSAGARLARPGEFTYRAVMNDKLDLTRAESVLELIRAKSPRAAAQALHNIRGDLSQKLTAAEDEIVFLMANLEAAIDFTTEDIQPVDFPLMLDRVRQLKSRIKTLVDSHVSGRVVSQGLKMALAGRPNAGKSSLMNKLVGRQRSIVADLPGTTRDTVDAEVLYEGFLFKFVDTAGLRRAENEIERQGIDRTLEEMDAADVVLYVIDAAQGLSNEDVENLRSRSVDETVVCFNKSDLKQVDAKNELARFGLNEFQWVQCSTVADGGVASLKDSVVGFAKKTATGEMTSVVSTQRQKEGLAAALRALENSENILSQSSASPELVAFELKDALTKVQEVLGKNVGDDVMDRVFREFCIGK